MHGESVIGSSIDPSNITVRLISKFIMPLKHPFDHFKILIKHRTGNLKLEADLSHRSAALVHISFSHPDVSQLPSFLFGLRCRDWHFVPSSVKIESIPSKATANGPQLRPYNYAMVDRDLVIVDPTNVLKK